jgi:VCBS repeat-containing protein
VSDGHGGVAIETLAFTIDRGPTAATHTAALLEGATVSGSTGDTDPDSDTPLTVAAVAGGTVGTAFAGSYGHLTLNADGSYSYTADITAAIDGAALGSRPVDTFSYTVSDGHGGTSTDTLAFTVDRAPVATAHTAGVLKGATLAGTTGDTDPDADVLTVTALAGGTVGSASAGTYGHLTLNADGSYSYAADITAAIDGAPAGHSTDTFGYTVNDGHGGTATETLAFTIDRAPVAAAHTASLLEGPTNSGSTGDTDPDGDLVIVTGITGGTVGTAIAGTYGSLTLNADLTYSYAANNTAAIDTASVSHPTDTFTYAVSDGHGGTTTETISFAIDRPTSLLSVAASGADIAAGNGDLNAGHVVSLTLNFNEAVNVAGGAPILTLNDGGSATYDSGSGTDALTFKYTVAAGENTADLAVTGLNLGGATVRDGAGHDAILASVVTNPSGTLQIDTTAPHLTNVAASPATGNEKAGSLVTFALTFDEAVKVAGGTPSLTLNDGGTAQYDAAATATLGDAHKLVFDYLVSSSDSATSSLAITGIDQHGAAVTDFAGNSAVYSNLATTFSGLTVNQPVSQPTNTGNPYAAYAESLGFDFSGPVPTYHGVPLTNFHI